jgi:hypothetical protein
VNIVDGFEGPFGFKVTTRVSSSSIKIVYYLVVPCMLHDAGVNISDCDAALFNTII